MWTIYLLPLLCLLSQAEPNGSHDSRPKREILSRSKRRWVLSTIEVVEEDVGPFPKLISQMFNNKLDKSSTSHVFLLKGNGVTKPPLGVFEINSTTGKLYALRTIDRETNEIFHISFDILDDNNAHLDQELSFDVKIKDLNDNAPAFKLPKMSVEVKENLQEGDLPAVMNVEDKDEINTPNSTITMRVVRQEPKNPTIGLKQINNNLAQLTFIGCFDYEKAKKYEVLVEAKDQGKQSMSSTATITLNIVDSNTHPPAFKEKTYSGSVLEAIIKDEVLRVGVTDKDTPKTPGWEAEYTIIKGNEDKNYKIVTDPETNEGILGVIKGKDFERTKMHVLEIGVKNKEPLFRCGKKSSATGAIPFDDIASVSVKVIDANDPPEFDKGLVLVYVKEEEEPGKVLLTPKVTDEDTDLDKIRFAILKDPAKWMTIDKKTGVLKAAKKMDRESSFVQAGIYKVLVGANDNDDPPATGTCTVLITLLDLNDNKPRLVSNVVTLCGNKHNKVMVAGNDSDAHPYGGPFTFSLAGDDKTLKQQWKLEPSTGEEAGLLSLKELAYGNYSVPFEIQDLQGVSARQTLNVVVCDCQDKNVCRPKLAKKRFLGSAAIGLIFASLLLFLLLLLVFTCECGQKIFKPLQVEGNQTLIKYNQEGGSAAIKDEAGLHLIPPTGATLTDGVKLGSAKKTQSPPSMNYNQSTYNKVSRESTKSYGGQRTHVSRESTKSYGGQRTHGTSGWSQSFNSRSNQQMADYNGYGTSGWSQSFNAHSNQQMADYNGYGTSRWSQSTANTNNHQIAAYLGQRLSTGDGLLGEHVPYTPCQYNYEGQGSHCYSLDQLSLSNLGDDLTFVNHLGPRFKNLGDLAQRDIAEKRIKL